MLALLYCQDILNLSFSVILELITNNVQMKCTSYSRTKERNYHNNGEFDDILIEHNSYMYFFIYCVHLYKYILFKKYTTQTLLSCKNIPKKSNSCR